MNNASTVCWRMIPEADRRPKIMELAPWAEGLRGARGGTPKQMVEAPRIGFLSQMLSRSTGNEQAQLFSPLR